MLLGKKKNLCLLFTVFLFLLFGFKDIWILASGKWPHLYAVVNTPRASWEEIYCYFPFTRHFSLSNLLPAAPMTNPGLSKLTNFPAITIISQGIIFKYVFFSNIDLYFLLMHTIFPILSFWLIYLVFKRYVATSWALLLAFFGVTSFQNFALLPYLFNLMVSPSAYIDTASLSPMELTRTPTPSFTFFFFIFSFYISTKKQKLSEGRYILMSVLWALNLYVYLFNFIAGILFWFLYIIYTRYTQDRHFHFWNMAKTLLINLLVVTAVISPIVVKRLFFFTPLDGEIFQRMELIVKEAGLFVSDWGWIVSYALPVAAVLLVIYLYCADYYELFYKFTPVFIMIFVEIFVSNIHIITGRFFQPYLFSMRIADYFLRYLYFLPILYFLSQPQKRLFHNDTQNWITDSLHSFVNRFIIRPRALLSFFGILVIGLFSLFSSVRYIKHYEDAVAPRMINIMKDYDRLISFVNGEKGIVVAEDIPVNLLIPVLTKEETLIVNGFSNYTTGAEILNRLVLFAHIFDWDKEKFLDFMMPSVQYNNFNFNNSFIFSDNLMKKGFGYWLLNHHRIMDTKEIDEYRDRIIKAYEDFDLPANIKRYRIRAVLAKGDINPLLSVKSVYRNDTNTVFY